MKKKFPDFKTDAEAEAFVETADLSEYDLSDMIPMRFALRRKNKSVLAGKAFGGSAQASTAIGNALSAVHSHGDRARIERGIKVGLQRVPIRPSRVGARSAANADS